MLRSITRSFNILLRQSRNFSVLQEVPVWSKPYDAKKYEVPSSKIKVSSGYAVVDVEPMPKAKIMKIGYILLDKLKVIQEDVIFRIYQEEKTKWIMEKTDEIDDIEELEAVLGTDSIERFILFWQREIILVDKAIAERPWEIAPTEEELKMMREFEKAPFENLRHQRVDAPERKKTEFLTGSS